MGLFKSCHVHKLLAIVFIGMPVSVLAGSSVIEVQNVTGRTLLIAVVPTKKGSKHSEIYPEPRFPTRFYVLFSGKTRNIPVPPQKLFSYDRAVWVVGNITNAVDFARSLYDGKRRASVQAFEVGSAPEAVISEKSAGIFKVDTTGRLLAAAKALIESAKAAADGDDLALPQDEGAYDPQAFLDQSSLQGLIAPFEKATQVIKQRAKNLTEQAKKVLSSATQKFSASNNPQGWKTRKDNGELAMTFDEASFVLGLSSLDKTNLKNFGKLSKASQEALNKKIRDTFVPKALNDAKAGSNSSQQKLSIAAGHRQVTSYMNAVKKQ